MTLPRATPFLQLTVLSDTICPWCYIGKRQLAAALPILQSEGLRFDVLWRPFQLDPTTPEAGRDRTAYRSAKFGSEQRARELDVRVARSGADVGIRFRHDLMERTPNTLASHALIRLARETGGAAVQDRVVEAVFSAYFTQGRDIGDLAVLAALAEGAGLERARILAGLSDPEIRNAVAEDETQARTVGLDGVPSFVVAGKTLFSGALPASSMVQALRDAGASLISRATPDVTTGTASASA